jgi:cytochrome bd-type quinol oxidase subunit 2
MAWQWWLLLHLTGVLAFVGAHGVSMVVLYRVRGERDRRRIAELIAFSGTTTRPMYIALGVLTLGGVGAGLTLHLFSAWWLWISIIILLVTIGLMTALAKPYFRKITAACEVRPSGVPRVSDEELELLLSSGDAHVITAIGGIGLLAILYLMLFKPF